MFLAAFVDASTETSITDEFLGVREARDVANCSENGHGSEQAEARDLHKEDHIVGPGLDIAKLSKFLINLGLLSFQVSNDFKIELNLKSGKFAEILLKPPGLVFISKKFAMRGDEIETLDNTVKAVLGHGELLANTRAERNESTEFADMDRGNPNVGDDIGN